MSYRVVSTRSGLDSGPVFRQPTHRTPQAANGENTPGSLPARHRAGCSFDGEHVQLRVGDGLKRAEMHFHREPGFQPRVLVAESSCLLHRELY
jgi:hypothetical protein